MFTPLHTGLAGIGLGVAVHLLRKSNASQPVLGISGFLNTTIALVRGTFTSSSPDGEREVGPFFIAGLLAGGLLLGVFDPTGFGVAISDAASSNIRWGLMIISGVLAGAGTRLGNGCTSGHMLCGVARLSPRSLFATTVFSLSAIITSNYIVIPSAAVAASVLVEAAPRMPSMMLLLALQLPVLIALLCRPIAGLFVAVRDPVQRAEAVNQLRREILYFSTGKQSLHKAPFTNAYIFK